MKNVLVIGALGGMGKAVCELLKEKGYNVYKIDYHPNNDSLDNYYQCDIRSMANIQNVYEDLSTKIDELYAIIHVAGVYYMDSLLEMEEERIKKIFDINVFGIYRINKVFLPLLKKGSRIIITSSEVAPLKPLPFNGIYSITKATIEKYAYSLRMETNLLGIYVAIIRPGAVKTNLLNNSLSELDSFCEKTEVFQNSSKKFKKIVDSVESKSITPERLAKVVYKAVKKRKPRYIYRINANFLLKLFNILPSRFQVYLIGKLLKSK